MAETTPGAPPQPGGVIQKVARSRLARLTGQPPAPPPVKLGRRQASQVTVKAPAAKY
jgi:hypothetical protein